MNDNLGGTSPYKQWNFTSTSTIRCVNCHGDPRKYNATSDGRRRDAAGDDLAPHTSQYRGMLIQNYKDRTLNAGGDLYAAADFALCFVCHAEEPYHEQRLERARTSGITPCTYPDQVANKGPNASTNIDTAGRRQRQRHLRRVPLPHPLHCAPDRHPGRVPPPRELRART